MIATENIKPFSEFNYWFLPIDTTIVNVFSTANNELICNLNIVDNSLDTQNVPESLILSDFEEYKLHRPEYTVIKPDIFENNNISHSDAEFLYDNMLAGSILMKEYRKFKRNPDDILSRIEKCINWLHNTDFYIAPASTIYHGNFEGGLLYHMLDVIHNIRDLIVIPKFKSVNIEDAVFVASSHDWCKINFYESYTKKAPNPQTGNWEPVKAFKRKDEMIPLGHGVASMYIAFSFFHVSKEESLAIRWHMGEYNVAPNEMDSLHSANCKYPIVQLLQFADRLSITEY